MADINLENDLRMAFLRQFMTSIFITLHPEILTKQNEEGEILSARKPIAQPKQIGQMMGMLQMRFQQPVQQINPLTPQLTQTQIQEMQMRQMKVPIPSYKMKEYFSKNKTWPTVQVPVQANKVMTKEIRPDNAGEKLNSVLSLIASNDVQSIECPGPGKPVLVTRNGKVESSNIVLRGEEIDAVLAEVARKTGIPLTEGMYRTGFNNLSFSAIRSEFVGARFIIQRANQ